MGGIDAEGLRIAAVFAPVGFMAGRFITAPSRSKNDPKLSPWSLTHVHEQLIPRYWPDGPSSEA
jgi:hypothetical protein